jgi:hypothetical protein
MDNKVGVKVSKTRVGVNNTPDNRDLARGNITRVRTGETRENIEIQMKADPGVEAVGRNLMNPVEETSEIHQGSTVNRVVARKGLLDNNLASLNMRPNQKPATKIKAPGEWKLTDLKEKKKTQKNIWVVQPL